MGVKFEIRSGLSFLKENPTGALQYSCFGKTNIPKCKLEACLKMYNSADKCRNFYSDINKSKTAQNNPPGGSRIFQIP